MKKRVFLMMIFLLAVVFLMVIPTAICEPFYKVMWSPETTHVILKLNYPDEAHQGDYITYNLVLNWTANVLINEFDFYINYLKDDGTWSTLWNTNLFSNVNVQSGSSNSYSQQIEIPAHAMISDITLNANFNIRANNSYDMEMLSIYTTHVVLKTTSELQQENNNLSNNLTSLNSEYSQYKQTHSYTNDQYQQALSGQQPTPSPQPSQSPEQSGSSGELNLYKTLTYVITPVAIIFVVLAVYFAIRKKNSANPKTTPPPP